MIEAQIDQMAGGGISDIAGDLSLNTAAPWLAWGPYAWADGSTPNSEGLFWLAEDFMADGTHPSASGVDKYSGKLMDFFLNSPFSSCWFLAQPTCVEIFQFFLPAIIEQ